ncbi:MAG: hypothetical protein ACUVR8_07370 [Acidobacteriota bacterium]
MVYSPPSPSAKKRNIWLWMLGGCGVVTVLGLVAAAIFFYVGYYAASRAVDEISKNPIRSAAKLIELANPDIEVVAVDEEKELVTFRDKKTGTTTTVSLKEFQERATSEDGKSRDEAGSSCSSPDSQPSSSLPDVGVSDKDNLPNWVPVYPGAKVTAKVASGNGNQVSGSLTLMTKDKSAVVLNFYETKLNESGFRVTRAVTGGYGTIAAKGPAGETLTVMVMKVEDDGGQEDEDHDDGTGIVLTYSFK